MGAMKFPALRVVSLLLLPLAAGCAVPNETADFAANELLYSDVAFATKAPGDRDLFVAPIVDASAVTVLSATVKGSSTTRSLCSQPLEGTLAIDPKIILDPCQYSLRALTGASTGALTNLQAYLLIEYCSV